MNLVLITVGLFLVLSFIFYFYKKDILTEKFAKSLIIIGFVSLIVFLVFFLVDEKLSFGKIDSAKFGQYGDIVGGFIGALWALSGVILFYLALIEERKSRKLNETDFEIKLENYKEEHNRIIIEQFENTFYNLLNLYFQVRKDIDKDIYTKQGEKLIYEKTVHGVDSFKFLYVDTFSNHYKRNVASGNSHFTIINTAFHRTYYDNEVDLGHYFRTLNNLLEYIISKSHFGDFYYYLFRDSISSYELSLIFYYSISDLIPINIGKQMIEYNFFNNISDHNIIDVSHRKILAEKYVT